MCGVPNINPVRAQFSSSPHWLSIETRIFDNDKVHSVGNTCKVAISPCEVVAVLNYLQIALTAQKCDDCTPQQPWQAFKQKDHNRSLAPFSCPSELLFSACSMTMLQDAGSGGSLEFHRSFQCVSRKVSLTTCYHFCLRSPMRPKMQNLCRGDLVMAKRVSSPSRNQTLQMTDLIL